MPNEVLLILELILVFGGVLAAFRFWGEVGLYCFTVLATVLANIEVSMVVNAFGMEQTLGNVLFAATFLVTDILSETAGKKAAGRAVGIGIATSVCFLVLTQFWALFTPAESDVVSAHLKAAFANTPRVLLASLVVYVIVQVFDVFAYHAIWQHTTKKCGDARRFLWLRNNGATLLSQLFNTLLFTFAAFYGVYEIATLWQIVGSTFLIYICTSLLDTPVVYLARHIAPKVKKIEEAE